MSRLALRSLKAVGRLGLRAVPKPIRKSVDDRFFYAVFNLTRVTNDHYPVRTEASEQPNQPGPDNPPG